MPGYDPDSLRLPDGAFAQTMAVRVIRRDVAIQGAAERMASNGKKDYKVDCSVC